MSEARVKLHLIPASDRPAAESECTESDVVLKGQLGIVSAVDIIQLISTRGQSWVIVIFDQGLEANVSIVNGELFDARWGNKSGHEALVEIVGTRSGYFEVLPYVDTGERTLFGLWQGNILAAVQRLDERVRAQSAAAPSMKDPWRDSTRRKQSGEYDFEAILSDTAFDPPSNSTADASQASSRSSRNVLELTDLGFAALRAGRIEEAKTHWAKALTIDPNNRALQFNLKKLQAYDRRS